MGYIGQSWASRSRRRGSSTLRAVVIALSTLAILLVVFSLYQYSQRGPSSHARDRLPKTRTEFADLPSADELTPAHELGMELCGPGPVVANGALGRHL